MGRCGNPTIRVINLCDLFLWIFWKAFALTETWFISVTSSRDNLAVPDSSTRHDLRGTQNRISFWGKEERHNSNNSKILCGKGKFPAIFAPLVK